MQKLTKTIVAMALSLVTHTASFAQIQQAALNTCTLTVKAPAGYVISEFEGVNRSTESVRFIIGRSKGTNAVDLMKPDFAPVPMRYQTKYVRRCHRKCRVIVYRGPLLETNTKLNQDQEKFLSGATTLNVLPLFVRNGAPFCMQQAAQIPPTSSNPVGTDLNLNISETKVLFFPEFGAPVRATLTLNVKLLPAPTITSVTPAKGPVAGSTQITIIGTDLTTNATVTVGGVPATKINLVSPTELGATTGPHNGAGKVDVQVTTPAGTATGIGLFEYQ